MHVASHYGVEAQGKTLSQLQANLAHKHIAAAGLADRCPTKVRHYLDLGTSELFD